MAFSVIPEDTFAFPHGLVKGNPMTTERETPVLLLTASEAAKALAISRRTLWAMTNAGEIPSVRIRRTLRYSPVALAAWIAGQTTPQLTEQV